jgi:hypothetical protein
MEAQVPVVLHMLDFFLAFDALSAHHGFVPPSRPPRCLLGCRLLECHARFALVRRLAATANIRRYFYYLEKPLTSQSVPRGVAMLLRPIWFFSGPLTLTGNMSLWMGSSRLPYSTR